MTQTQQYCSTPNQLLTFLRGQLSVPEESEFQLHLNDCVLCRERLENAAADSIAWNEAKQFFGNIALHTLREDSNSLYLKRGLALRSRDDFPAISCLAGEGQTPFQAETNDPDEESHGSQWIRQVLDSLAPTDDPESLGRIGGYEVTGIVGAGGMGVVLKAHDCSLDRIVAIKVMSPHLASSGSARKRFAREAKAAAAVLHPNVIAIHSVASEDVNPYLVMPYVRGASLQKRIDSQGPLPLKDTLRIGVQIAAGLAAAHEQGLVHRDIKPANILLEEGVERVTITDFGLARAVDDASITRSGVIAGTPQYMSPEQTRGEPIDARSDLFSLGSVLYAMCAGRSPFRAEATYGVLHRIANDNPTPVGEVNSDVLDWLGDIIQRLMAKRPEDRFESAAQVAELLEGCLAHVQQPAVMPLPNAVQALAAQSQRRSSEIRKPNRLKALYQRIPPFAKLVAGAAFASAIIFAGILIVLELNKGTLTIESEFDDVPIRIIRGENFVERVVVTKGENSTRFAAGKYTIELDEPSETIVVDGGAIVLRRGEVERVRITATSAKTDGTTELEGVWHLESAIDSDGKTRDLQLYEHWTFRGHRLLFEFATAGHWACDVEVDAKAKTIGYRKDGEDELSPADYVLIGDQLTIYEHPPQRKVLRRGRAMTPVSLKVQRAIDALVTIKFSGTTDSASIFSSGMGWRVDDAGHILVPSHVAPECENETIELRDASGAICPATRLKTLGHLTLLKSERIGEGPPILVDSIVSLTSGAAVSAILNGTDIIPGSISSARKTIAISERDGVEINPALRFQNVMTTDFVADETTLSGAPLLTKSGDVAGMLLRLGMTQMIAIPVSEIRVALRQL